MILSDGRNVVFWSGGNDSTLVALRLLRANKYPYLISFASYHIGGFAQQNKEKIFRKHLLHKFKEEFGDRFEYTEYTYEGESEITLQDQFWCSLAPTLLKNNDKIHLGFIRYDDVWHKIEKFKTAILSMTDFLGKKDIEIEFPLEWSTKNDVRKELKKYGYLENTILSNDSIESKWVKPHDL